MITRQTAEHPRAAQLVTGENLAVPGLWRDRQGFRTGLGAAPGRWDTAGLRRCSTARPEARPGESAANLTFEAMAARETAPCTAAGELGGAR
jgi:hypothetical protein